jgi:hypothetical protein
MALRAGSCFTPAATCAASAMNVSTRRGGWRTHDLRLLQRAGQVKEKKAASNERGLFEQTFSYQNL